jgi:hypothetical protein
MKPYPRRLHLLAFLLLLAGCRPASTPPLAPATFSTGYWFWSGSDADQPHPVPPLDLLYFHAADIQFESYRPGDPWYVGGDIPSALPPARQYWAVYRFNLHGIPDLKTVPLLRESLERLLSQARHRGLRLTGVQLDIDSPTGSLPRYAAYLHAVKQELPPGLELSITALLDWFRPGTAIAKVVAEVDEFVPQFYDLQGPRESLTNPAIAAPVSAAQWARLFGRFTKRFRLGLSTFGRARGLESAQPRNPVFYFADTKPFDFGVNPHFALQTSRTPAGELLLQYRATRPTRIGYQDFDPGAGAEFVLATPESIAAGVAQARLFGPYCAGVLFFRWPSTAETLAAPPADVLAAAGLLPNRSVAPVLIAQDGNCAAVHCIDLILLPGNRLLPAPSNFLIRSTAPLDYILPERSIPLRLAGPLELTLRLPAYTARGQLYLGRVVSTQPARFTLEPR